MRVFVCVYALRINSALCIVSMLVCASVCVCVCVCVFVCVYALIIDSTDKILRFITVIMIILLLLLLFKHLLSRSLRHHTQLS